MAVDDLSIPPPSIPLTLKFIEDVIKPQHPSLQSPLKTKPAPIEACRENPKPAKCAGDGSASDPECKLASAQPDGVPHAPDGGTKLAIYFGYAGVLESSIDKFIYKRIMKHFRKFSKCGTDNETGFRTIEYIIEEVDAVRAELDEAMDALDAFETQPFPKAIVADMIEYCVSIRKLHFYFHTVNGQLREMYDIRRFSLFNFLVILMRPYVDNIIVKEVYMRWVDLFSWSSINESRQNFEEFWNWLGYGYNEEGGWPGLMPSGMLKALINFLDTLLQDAPS